MLKSIDQLTEQISIDQGYFFLLLTSLITIVWPLNWKSSTPNIKNCKFFCKIPEFSQIFHLKTQQFWPGKPQIKILTNFLPKNCKFLTWNNKKPKFLLKFRSYNQNFDKYFTKKLQVSDQEHPKSEFWQNKWLSLPFLSHFCFNFQDLDTVRPEKPKFDQCFT